MTLLDQLMRDEGLRLKPYYDTRGRLTIGIGRNLDDRGLTREEALYLAKNDLAESVREIQRLLPWTVTLSAPRFGVLVNMTYNMGIGGLLGFREMLRALKDGDYRGASHEMLDSAWAGQVGARAHRLARQMETDEWV